MKIISLPRLSGKTTISIIYCAITGTTPVVISERHKKNLLLKAKNLNLTIPEPIVYNNKYKFIGIKIDKIIIDDFDIIAKRIVKEYFEQKGFDGEIEYAFMTADNKKMEENKWQKNT